MSKKKNLVVKHTQPHDVYIGRGSKWGNKFVVGFDGNRTECIDKFICWFFQPEQSKLRDAAKTELKEKVLGCHCSPKACHGDFLSAFANGRDYQSPDGSIAFGDGVQVSEIFKFASFEEFHSLVGDSQS